MDDVPHNRNAGNLHLHYACRQLQALQRSIGSMAAGANKQDREQRAALMAMAIWMHVLGHGSLQTDKSPAECEANAAPPLRGKASSHRNLTGRIPDETREKFNQIAASVKVDARLERVLVNM